jgi:hypothetical protein
MAEEAPTPRAAEGLRLLRGWNRAESGVWARLVGLRRAVIEDIRLGSQGEVVLAVRMAGG